VFVIPALGGAERRVATISVRGTGQWSSNHLKLPPNLTWTPDAKWIAFGGRASDNEAAGIWLVASDGTETRRLTMVTGHEFGDSGPAFSPDGRNLAFIRERTLSASAVYVLPLSSALTPAGSPKRVTRERAAVQGLAWMPDGSGLVFSSGGHLGLSRMQRITLAATPARDVDQSQPLSFGEHATGISISRTGHLVYSAQFRDTNLWKLALSGQDLPGTGPIAASTLDEHTPDYSPDGKRLALASTRSGSEEIWVSDVDGSDPMQLTSMEGPNARIHAGRRTDA
jgi:Tol biopolymer transport system component